MIRVHEEVAVLAFVTAVAAATYSTWSPCGQSMLSQLNPLAEGSRGQRFRITATWFVLGALVGAAMLGAAMAGLAAAVEGADLTLDAALGIAGAVALVGAAVDARLLPWSPPFIRRQVNETWLPHYRGWVYGFGFGWQIGTGLTTYVMTAAVFGMIVLGALVASPWTAFGIAMAFGVVRGAAVFITDRCTTFERLAAFHRRFDVVGVVVRRVVIGVQAAVGVAAATIAWGIGGFAATIVVVSLGLALHRYVPVRVTDPTPTPSLVDR
jgi:hypothetical protein